MIATLRRLRAASWAQRKLLAEAVASLACARILFALLPFSKAASLARLPSGEPPAAVEREREIAAVRRAVPAAARRVPWRAKCLEQGFAAQWMLRRRAIPATIHYGVSRLNGELKAHVWVRSGETDIVGCENRTDFAEIARFPDRTS